MVSGEYLSVTEKLTFGDVLTAAFSNKINGVYIRITGKACQLYYLLAELFFLNLIKGNYTF